MNRFHKKCVLLTCSIKICGFLINSTLDWQSFYSDCNSILAIQTNICPDFSEIVSKMNADEHLGRARTYVQMPNIELIQIV